MPDGPFEVMKCANLTRLLEAAAEMGTESLRKVWNGQLTETEQAALRGELESTYKPRARAVDCALEFIDSKAQITTADGRLELLRDRDGVYGVGFVGTFVDRGGEPPRIITRPDKLNETTQRPLNKPVLQAIPRARVFRYSMEYELWEALFTAMLARSGFDRGEDDATWWSDGPRNQAANRRRYHGLKAMALRITNAAIRQALASAHPEALAMARRFPAQERYAVYCIAARSARFLQLCETFPVLALIIAGRPDDDVGRKEALAMIEAGRRLNIVAGSMGVPIHLRGIMPGATLAAAHILHECEGVDEEGALFYSHLPAGVHAQKRWLEALREAARLDGPFVDWVGKHALELGVTIDAVRAQVQDLGDFVRASYVATVPAHAYTAIVRQFADGRDLRAMRRRASLHGVRPFLPDMSVATVRKLSGQWHEAVALADTKNTAPLPPPWRGADRIGDLEIVPLATAAEIAAEGRAMHHCAATLTDQVRCGASCLYSACDGNGKRVATIEVTTAAARDYALPVWPSGVFIRQMRGPCNAILPKKVQALIRRWVRQKDKWQLPARNDPAHAMAQHDGDIPF